MIKFREKLPNGWSLGISGISHLFVYLNSRLAFWFSKLLKLRQTESLVYGLNILTFLLIFIELYLINSIAAGIFALFYERFIFILVGTIVLFFFGRASLPYWSEAEDDDED